MKTIQTLIEDIYALFEKEQVVSREDVEAFGKNVAEIIGRRLSEKKGGTYLRLSNLGEKCDRKQWLKVHHPELAEPMHGSAHLKFMLGDLFEATILFLARVAGHKVEGEQQEVSLYGVPGHRDAVIDGNLVDAKSASSFAFQKFANHLTEEQDDFGYIRQLTGYLEEAQNDPLVTNKDSAFFLVGDKTLGKLVLDEHKRADTDWESLVKRKQAMLESPDLPPRAYEDIPEGKSGNRKLGTACSYCEMKNACWPNLQKYNYAKGPVYLTKVARVPKVPKEEEELF